MKLKGPEFRPLSGDVPRSICVMLHGVGADGENLIDLAAPFAQDFPDTYFIAPNGPEQFSGGGNGYQWFPYYERSRDQILDGVNRASKTVSEFAYQLLDKFSLQPSNLILMGFSQGAMTAIHTGLTMQDNCAGVVSFSGGLLKVEMTEFEARSQPPVCLIHGEYDDVVPCQMSEASAQILSGLHVPAEFHRIKDLAHSIDINCVNIAKGFIGKVLK